VVPPRRTSTGDLGWLLDDLVSRLPQARRAAVLSTGGLLVAASQGLDRADAEYLCAVAAGFHSLARGAGRHFGGGRVRQTLIEMDSAYLFVAAAGAGACLALLASQDADVGLVAYEIARLANRLGERLGRPVRAVAPAGPTAPVE
jgi:predicted regulator of Ras-like GTPase activity (Roadblock/LC7/MglB family)